MPRSGAPGSATSNKIGQETGQFRSSLTENLVKSIIPPGSGSAIIRSRDASSHRTRSAGESAGSSRGSCGRSSRIIGQIGPLPPPPHRCQPRGCRPRYEELLIDVDNLDPLHVRAAVLKLAAELPSSSSRPRTSLIALRCVCQLDLAHFDTFIWPPSKADSSPLVSVVGDRGLSGALRGRRPSA